MPAGTVECPTLEVPGPAGCALADDTPVRCLVVERQAVHCAEDRRSAVIAVSDRCPKQPTRRLQGDQPYDSFTIAFCQAVAQQALVAGLVSAAAAFGVYIGPTGDTIVGDSSDDVADPFLDPILAAAQAASAAVRRRLGDVPPPLVVPQPADLTPGHVVFANPDGSLVISPPGSPLPEGHVALALPFGLPVAFFAGQGGAPGALVVAPGATPAQWQFGYTLAWMYATFPGLNANQLQLLAALATPGVGPEVLPPLLHAGLEYGQRVGEGNWVRVIRGLAKSVKSPTELAADIVTALSKRLRSASVIPSGDIPDFASRFAALPGPPVGDPAPTPDADGAGPSGG